MRAISHCLKLSFAIVRKVLYQRRCKMGSPKKYSSREGYLTFVCNYLEESIGVDMIRYIQTKNKVCTIYVKDLDPFVTYVPLSKLYDQLPRNKFVKVNRSNIVAISEIKEINQDHIILKDGIRIPISMQSYNRFVLCLSPVYRNIFVIKKDKSLLI